MLRGTDRKSDPQHSCMNIMSHDQRETLLIYYILIYITFDPLNGARNKKSKLGDDPLRWRHCRAPCGTGARPPRTPLMIGFLALDTTYQRPIAFTGVG